MRNRRSLAPKMKTIRVSLPEHLIDLLDEYAGADNSRRSSLLQSILAEHLYRAQVWDATLDEVRAGRMDNAQAFFYLRSIDGRFSTLPFKKHRHENPKEAPHEIPSVVVREVQDRDPE